MDSDNSILLVNKKVTQHFANHVGSKPHLVFPGIYRLFTVLWAEAVLFAVCKIYRAGDFVSQEINKVGDGIFHMAIKYLALYRRISEPDVQLEIKDFTYWLIPVIIMSAWRSS